ncbi:universal stress protein [Longimycelium tulufanense]|uniref:universal stress protein n=1 Tax=Longimycelium tulufanense TaxID=907463 RepID=UPI001E3B799C|nr:universal stress protein [Longimycelium tulufanense]
MPPSSLGFEIGKVGVGAIVVGIDGTPSSGNAAAWAAGLASRERAQLVLAYVEPVGGAAYWAPSGVAVAAETATELVDELRAELERSLSNSDVAWELLHLRGDPARMLEKVADERRADCIVVGRSRHSGRFLGSVPKTLVTEAVRPVVVVP